ncbi:MAG: hypothetical protein OQK35_00750 [Alphaproteobacteria bacterium]|nr:hypothetical protein [Rhodospirillales bacterium]MCW9044837.1 hypothetical protein [Alphaproteobacteria bacterium]
MNTTTKSILAVSALVIGTAVAVPAFADKDDNDCDRWSKKYSMMKGDHYMGGMYGGRPGKRGFFRDDLDLSVEDVKNILEGRLAWQGNKNLKVGEVKAKDDDVVLAQIVTKDGSLVQQLEIDRDTGRPRSIK